MNWILLEQFLYIRSLYFFMGFSFSLNKVAFFSANFRSVKIWSVRLFVDPQLIVFSTIQSLRTILSRIVDLRNDSIRK